LLQISTKRCLQHTDETDICHQYSELIDLFLCLNGGANTQISHILLRLFPFQYWVGVSGNRVLPSNSSWIWPELENIRISIILRGLTEEYRHHV